MARVDNGDGKVRYALIDSVSRVCQCRVFRLGYVSDFAFDAASQPTEESDHIRPRPSALKYRFGVGLSTTSRKACGQCGVEYFFSVARRHRFLQNGCNPY